MANSRFDPLSFHHLRTRNRVVVPPMASETADERGFVTEKTIEHYQRLAKSGAGLIFVEYSFVHPSGRSEKNQLGASEDIQIPGLSRIARVIHESKALAGLQIVHGGGKSLESLTGRPLQSPSGVLVPVQGWQPDRSQMVDLERIQDWISWFVAAARRAALAGFDLIEIHAAHGYGINQWLSSLTNVRTDRYGGSISNRARLLFEIVEKIRAELPGLAVAVRIPAQDHLPGGLLLEEMAWVAAELERRGVSLLDVSSGIGGWRRPANREGEGYLVPDAAAIKRHVSIPVIGVGGIVSGAYIDQVVSQNVIDLTAVGRAILRDPAQWKDQTLCPSL